jgi:N-acylglucosamine-6-phosphate 2-epimerase
MPISLPQFIVSVQAEQDEPLAPLPIISALCESVLSGGAEGLRLADNDLIRAMKAAHPDLPIIGIHKPFPLPTGEDALNQVYITRTAEQALAVAAAGADIVALDATPRDRGDSGETLVSIIEAVKIEYPKVQIMGDVDTLESAEYAVEAGVEILSTTLCGYTEETRAQGSKGPAFRLMDRIIKRFVDDDIPVYLEGRIWNQVEVKNAIERGARGVVVGSAITRPHHITHRFKGVLADS